MTQTFYDLLGVPTDASTAEIEDAYRDEIKEVHPDVSDEVDAAERTKRLNEAKRVLTDDEERRRYDRLGHDAYTNGGIDARGATDSGSGGVGSTTGASGGGSSTRSSSTSDRRRRRGRARAGEGYQRRESDSDRSRSSGATEAGSSRERTGSRRADWSAGRDAENVSGNSTGPSRGRSGPTWQSSGGGASASPSGGSADGPSARRQAAAGSTDGPNAEWSWNGWAATRSWAVRQSAGGHDGLHPSRLFPTDQSVVLLASCFLLYPFFVFAILFPPFPLVARVAVGVCTLLMFAYLLSIPEVAVVVYGVWSVLVPLGIYAIPGLSIVSIAGLVGLSVTWIPLGISALTMAVIRP
jgi:curved DNA-binding protein CbpA